MTIREKKRLGGRRVGAATILAVTVFVSGVSAAAAGSFTSELDSVPPGFGSRIWSDSSSPNNYTTIRSWSCWDDQFWDPEAKPTYELLKRNVGPVTSYGTRTAANCKGNRYASVSWWDPPSGNYNFAYRLVNGDAHSFSAAEIYVTW